MPRAVTVWAAGLTAMTLVSCISAKHPPARPVTVMSAPGASLWHTPTDLPGRNLYDGPWGSRNAPVAGAVYTQVRNKRSGVNPGMTVVDDRERQWSVKQAHPGGFDAEGPVEVTISRLLSAVGYHQPPVYFLPAFTLKDDWGTHAEIGGRFRLKDAPLTETTEWKWEDNPFVDTQAYRGLLVMLMMFNSTDLKNSNNSIFEHEADGRLERWYVVRDLGAALGDTSRFAPRKNHVVAFEQHPFILGVSDGRIDFANNGRYRDFVRDRVTREDFVWASELLARLSDRQWNDAFRAGGYSPAIATRFIHKLKQKVAEGRVVGRAARVGD
jgi:hypothetical protein